MPTALAIGGGGSRGDFQVGAVQYVYQYMHETENAYPTILCGTSSGSIIAAKLCEGEVEGFPNRGLKGLVHFFEGLRVNQDMWREEAWLANLQPDALRAITSAGLVILATAALGPLGFLASVALTGDDFERFVDDLEKAATAKCLYNLQPIRDMAGDPNKFNPVWVAESGNVLRMTTIALESGKLRYVTQNAQVLERDFSPVYRSVTCSAQCQPLAQDLATLEDQLREVQEALVNREPGASGAEVRRLRGLVEQARTALDTCMHDHPPTAVPLVVPLVDGIIASASIPTAFAPVKLGNEYYVDGGVRDMVPIDPAVRLGATRVYAICASCAAVAPARSVVDSHLLPDFTNANLLDIASRVSMDLMTNEITRNKTDPPNGWAPTQVILIEPDFDIHDIMTIDAGLIRIRMAHGYMRADNTVRAYNQDTAHYRQIIDTVAGDRNASTIVRLRRAIWEREYAANMRPYRVDASGRPVPVAEDDWLIPPDPTAMEDVRRMKLELKALVEERIAAGGKVPPEYWNWWLKWEGHDWEPRARLWPYDYPNAPLYHLRTTANPATIPQNVPTQVLVTATATSGAAVTNARVLVNGMQVGVTGTPFTHTFTGHWIRVRDPDDGTFHNELVDDEVTVQGQPDWQYFEEPVACEFYPGVLDAQIVSQSAPGVLAPGQTAAVAVTVMNCGTVTWTPAEGYRLGSQSPQDNTIWGTGRASLPGPVAPGAQVTINFNVTAPATAGSYTFQWKMLLEGVTWFGALTPLVTVTVAVPTPRAAEFVSQYTPVRTLAGKLLPTSTQIVMKNTGTETWTAAAGYKLGSQCPPDNVCWTKNRIPVPTSVPPGQTVTFKFSGCYAPTAIGTYNFQWQMVQDGVGWFGPLTPVKQIIAYQVESVRATKTE